MANQNIDLDGYVTVDERLREFFKKYPEGRMRPVNPDRPFTIERIPDGSGQEHTYIVYVAAAYRTPDDPNPAIGVAYEQFPGRTSFTRTSELMNAETSAWGRALAALGIGIKGKIATRDEVYAATQRRAEPERQPQRSAVEIGEDAVKAQTQNELRKLWNESTPQQRKEAITSEAIVKTTQTDDPILLGDLLRFLKAELGSEAA